LKRNLFHGEAVDKMLDQIGENEVISNSFMDYVDYSLENNERISLNKSLYGSAKEFVKDVHYEHLKSNKGFRQHELREHQRHARKEIAQNKKQAIELATRSIELFNQGILKSKIAQGKTESEDFLRKY
jgi:hypothetical protein